MKYLYDFARKDDGVLLVQWLRMLLSEDTYNTTNCKSYLMYY